MVHYEIATKPDIIKYKMKTIIISSPETKYQSVRRMIFIQSHTANEETNQGLILRIPTY